MNFNFDEIRWNMNIAFEQAKEASWNDEVPVGAVIVSESNQVLAKSFNLKEKTNDPCGHAEILAIKKACSAIENWRLIKCSMFVTLEPCPMCLGAILQSRIDNLYFGAYDPKGGAISNNYNLYKDSRLNHNFSVYGGLNNYDNAALLSAFFRKRRKNYKSGN